MSASDVMVQLPITSSSSRPVSGSKIVDDDRYVRVEVAHEQRGPQRPGVVAGDHHRCVCARVERLAQFLVGRILEPLHLGFRRAQRLRGLLVQVAFAKQ